MFVTLILEHVKASLDNKLRNVKSSVQVSRSSKVTTQLEMM